MGPKSQLQVVGYVYKMGKQKGREEWEVEKKEWKKEGERKGREKGEGKRGSDRKGKLNMGVVASYS